MKVIKRAERPTKRCPKVRFTCPVCGSRLEEWRKAMDHVYNERTHEPGFGFECPVCDSPSVIRVSEVTTIYDEEDDEE